MNIVNNSFEKYKTLVMVGKPGSGKGTQAKLVAEQTDWKVFSTGDKFRELKKADTVLGRKIKATTDSGNLMPYWFASFLFEEAVVYLPADEGIIYEGAGRLPSEAELFHDVMQWLERPYRAIYLDVHADVSMDRLKKRKLIEGRADDDEDKIKVRLGVHEKEVEPAMDVFRGKGTLLHINGDQTPEKVFEEICAKLKEA
jgi:adenylate kinase